MCVPWAKHFAWHYCLPTRDLDPDGPARAVMLHKHLVFTYHNTRSKQIGGLCRQGLESLVILYISKTCVLDWAAIHLYYVVKNLYPNKVHSSSSTQFQDQLMYNIVYVLMMFWYCWINFELFLSTRSSFGRNKQAGYHVFQMSLQAQLTCVKNFNVLTNIQKFLDNGMTWSHKYYNLMQ